MQEIKGEITRLPLTLDYRNEKNKEGKKWSEK